MLNADDLLKQRFDYAWKYFDFHAKQRTSMLNFFLIVTGIFANAYVVVLKENLSPWISTGIAFMGVLTSIAFVLLEWRNHALVNMGEAVLRKLEQDELFVNYMGTDDKEKVIPLGFLSREAAEEKLRKEGKLNRTKGCGERVKHRHIIPWLEGLFAICFVIALVIPHFRNDGAQSKTTINSQTKPAPQDSGANKPSVGNGGKSAPSTDNGDPSKPAQKSSP